jgi:hypothetical protein
MRELTGNVLDDDESLGALFDATGARLCLDLIAEATDLFIEQRAKVTAGGGSRNATSAQDKRCREEVPASRSGLAKVVEDADEVRVVTLTPVGRTRRARLAFAGLVDRSLGDLAGFRIRETALDRLSGGAVKIFVAKGKAAGGWKGRKARRRTR